MIISILLLIFSCYFLYKNKKQYLLSDNKIYDKKNYQINLVIGILLFIVSLIYLVKNLLG
jgi:hypothetical protein